MKAAALSERGQAEEELIKAKNQAHLEEVSHTDVHHPLREPGCPASRSTCRLQSRGLSGEAGVWC